MSTFVSKIIAPVWWRAVARDGGPKMYHIMTGMSGKVVLNHLTNGTIRY